MTDASGGFLASLAEKAGALGFAAWGITPPRTPPRYAAFLAWLDAGRHGAMAWMARHRALRGDPRGLLPSCRAILSFAYPYGAVLPRTEDGYTLARYTQPGLPDYHVRLRALGKEIAALLSLHFPGARSRVCVDSAPLMERGLAWAAGLGFIGKNTCLIVPGAGSFVFLMEVLTTAPLPASPRSRSDSLCGTCTRCLDACPSGALEAPYRLDASRCLSYATIEAPLPLDPRLGARMGTCIYGCDACQEVCPWNQASVPEVLLPHTDTLLSMEGKRFHERFGHTALARGGLERLKEAILAIRRARAEGVATAHEQG